MAETKREKYKFLVKERADGTPWIVLETLSPKSIFQKEHSLFLDLQPNTSLSAANQLATDLNNTVQFIGVTIF